MEFLQRSWAQIRVFLDKLDRNTRITIWSVLIAGLLAAFVAVQWAGKPERVPISAFTTNRHNEVVAVLQAVGIDSQIQNGQVVVPRDKHAEALYALQQKDLLKEDVSAAWAEYLSQQNPWDTDANSQKKYLIALQQTLAQQIAQNPAIRSAAVTIAPEERKGFGRSHARRTATVSIVMEGSRRLDKAMVRMAAVTVASAVPGMKPEDVGVIDVNAGQAHKVRPEEEIAPTDYLQLVRQIEEHEREKILELLQYIHGVVVQVNVQLDDVSRKHVRTAAYAAEGSLRRQFTEEIIDESRLRAAEPGVQPNTGFASVDGGGATTTASSTNRAESEFNPAPLLREEESQHVGYLPQRINVAVNVPRSFVVALYRQDRGAGAPEPDDAALEPYEERQRATIEALIRPLVAKANEGIVTVSVFPDVLGPMPTAPEQASTLVTVLTNDWMQHVWLGALALVPLFLMLRMVRKATAPQPLPSVEELAGVPPSLPVDDDVMGEAAADENEMSGVEVDESELRYRKIAQQISELVKENPEEASALMRRWVNPDE